MRDMLFVDIIRTKRDGRPLSDAQIDQFVAGLADDSLPAEQVAALAMAVFLNGMTVAEAGHLTTAMMRSGTQLDWTAQGLDGPVVDKHSTGGVGDKVSFLLAPLAAACGLYVPMISGRGLGHTGGTLDKIATVPGYDATPDLDRFRRVVSQVGCAIVGQSDDLAPADRRFYAIRDVTATTESVPLITASILSKKIAAGNQALVMDVKLGSGAFMTTRDDAEALARSLIDTARAAGLVTHALITDMNQVLGTTAGNAVEMREVVDFLTGRARNPRLYTVTLALVAEMLVAGGVEADREVAADRAARALDDGSAADRFNAMLAALGGPADFLERAEQILPSAPYVVDIMPDRPGFLASVDTRAVGNAVIELGGGRRRLDDRIDLAVGFSHMAALGDPVAPDRPLARVHARTAAAAELAGQRLRAACQVCDDAPTIPPLIHTTLTPFAPVAPEPAA
ncbi:thymidine phosphorylase [Rhodothalassium salexigens]|nr:thymidine phosphorylase [Rhodothalassium salexigens]MBB4212128.1 thymidine phosphorylase [Rhodothalassium salexigens DSM 2132]